MPRVQRVQTLHIVFQGRSRTSNFSAVPRKRVLRWLRRTSATIASAAASAVAPPAASSSESSSVIGSSCCRHTRPQKLLGCQPRFSPKYSPDRMQPKTAHQPASGPVKSAMSCSAPTPCSTLLQAGSPQRGCMQAPTGVVFRCCCWRAAGRPRGGCRWGRLVAIAEVEVVVLGWIVLLILRPPTRRSGACLPAAAAGAAIAVEAPRGHASVRLGCCALHLGDAEVARVLVEGVLSKGLHRGEPGQLQSGPG